MRRERKSAAFDKLAAAANRSDADAIAEAKAEIVVRDSDGLLLPETVDLTGLGELQDGDLVALIGEDLIAIEKLEAQSFRHAVRAAAAFSELERRERARAALAGEKFVKKPWAEQVLGEHFAGQIAYRTMQLYEQVARPENIQHAYEFEEKIQAVRALKASGKTGEALVQAATSQGISAWEAETIPEQFSLRGLRAYLKERDRAFKEKSWEHAKPAGEVKVSVECPEEIADELEIALRRVVAKYAALPKGAIKETGRNLKSSISGQVKRRFSFPTKE